MISTEWGHPRSFCQGFNPEHLKDGHYGTHINVFDWKEGKLIQVSYENIRKTFVFPFLINMLTVNITDDYLLINTYVFVFKMK